MIPIRLKHAAVISELAMSPGTPNPIIKRPTAMQIWSKFFVFSKIVSVRISRVV